MRGPAVEQMTQGDVREAEARWPRPVGQIRSMGWPHGRYWWGGPWRLVNGTWRRCYLIPTTAVSRGRRTDIGYVQGPGVEA